MEQCVLTFLGTIAFLPPHGVEDCTVLLSSSACALGCVRDPLLDFSRLLGLALRSSRSCLALPLGNLGHAGGWHFRRGTLLRSPLLCRFVIFVGWWCTALN